MPSKDEMRKAQKVIYNPPERDELMTNITQQLSIANSFSWEEIVEVDERCVEITKNCKSFNFQLVSDQ